MPAPSQSLLAFAASQDLLLWTQANRMIAGKPFRVIPPLRGLYASRAPQVVVIKSAQVMISEWLINSSLWTCATGQAKRGNALYLFPHERQIRDFSQARIDKAIDESPAITALSARPASVFLKKVGKGHLYVRGAQTREGLISMDIDHLVCDEIAQYDPETIGLAQKRLGSSLMAWTRCASTPVYPSDQAGLLWEGSTKSRFAVACPHCAARTPLDIEMLHPERAILVCPHCKEDMTAARLGEGEWVAEAPGREWEGYHLTKLLSPLTPLPRLAAAYMRVLEGRATPAETSEFWNSEAGRAYLPEGGHLSTELLDDCVDPEWTVKAGVPEGEGDVVMGVDVGSRLHVRVNLLREDRVVALHIDTVRSFEQLDELMARYKVRACVIDANPDTRKAQEFAERWKRRVWLAYYPSFAVGREVGLCVWKDEDRVVNIRRTVAMDRVQGLVYAKTLVLPRDARIAGGDVDRAGVGEYYRHMQSPVRVIKLDPGGNTIAAYEHNGPDHYAHAEVYALVAANRLRETGTATAAAANPRITPAYQSSVMDQAAEVLEGIRRRQKDLVARYFGHDPEDIDDDEYGGVAVAGGRTDETDVVGAILTRYHSQTLRHVRSEEDTIETATFPPL